MRSWHSYSVFGIFVSCLLAVALAFTPTVFAAEQIEVEAEGSGTTKMAALQAAWQEAVRKGVGLFMTSKTQVIDDSLTEQIATYMGLYRRWHL